MLKKCLALGFWKGSMGVSGCVLTIERDVEWRTGDLGLSCAVDVEVSSRFRGDTHGEWDLGILKSILDSGQLW